MNDILCEQLSRDYCCSKADVLDDKNHFTEHSFIDGRRRYHEKEECYLKLIVINGKILFTGQKDIINWCQETYAEEGSEWFLEAKNLHRLNDRLGKDGYQIGMVHPFYITEKTSEVDTSDYEIKWYRGKEIEQFRGDSRFCEAYTFCKTAPDMVGVAAIRDGNILGMAGASMDSPLMWQIGINVEPAGRKKGIGKKLVTLLKNEILTKGRLPYYGTSMGHIASQKVALGAGFIPAWAELVTDRIELSPTGKKF
ncbi:GNAT family N-acetyltransferase [Butyrivibrio sp. AC2005]|uniref:GNAT family N-acetyltransferase n=1 Tax=Butyrivibrio sp. AC2005 TaxID=1280672 RepID=UPI0004218A6B|nr:GNAT family N-acetyltransferase [Butyrivibrio sp. AC2005]